MVDQQMKQQLQTFLEKAKAHAEKMELDASRALKRDQDHDELLKGRKLSGADEGQGQGQGQGQEDLWKKVNEEGHKATNTEANAFQDWRAAMLYLVNMNLDMCKALIQTRKEYTEPVENALMDGVLAVYDKIKNKLSGPPQVNLGALDKSVHANDKNEIVFDNIEPPVPTKDLDYKGQLNELFKQGVTSWLGELGYAQTPNSPNKYQSVNTGDPLTQDEFNELKDHPVQGLAAYLNDEFEPAPGLRPSI